VLADRYELGSQLGRGGMATVYEAHDTMLDRAVAVKLLRVFDQANARQRFAAEARNAARLTHPHAVGVYDVNVSTDRPFIVMELVRGETLEDVLARDGSLDTRSVIAIGCQVLAALHAAHRRGLVHRDVKPANILLPDGKVPSRADELPGIKLADFGIAKPMQDATIGLTMAGQVIGTPKYLSPEQVRGQRATPRSDIYATAVVLFEMLAGRPPFEQDSAVGLALAHREDEPPPLGKLRPDLDPELVALIHRALAKDPEQRPADANEMRLALLGVAPAPSGTQVLPDNPTELTPAPPSPGTTDRPRRSPRQPKSLRLLWTVVFGVAIAVLGIVLAERLADPPTPSDEPTSGQQAPADAGGQAPEAGGEQAPDAGEEQPQEGVAPPAPDAAPTADADAAPAVEPEPAPEPEPTG
jgi:serine/threonine protein kinase